MSQSELESVKAITGQFYNALNDIFNGDVEPMKAVWSHEDDITYMGPMGEIYVGWSDILSVWNEQAALKLGGQVNPEKITYIVGSDLATTHNYEVGINTNAKGKEESVSIRVTNVFRKENSHWKMVGHHTDLLLYLVKNS